MSLWRKTGTPFLFPGFLGSSICSGLTFYWVRTLYSDYPSHGLWLAARWQSWRPRFKRLSAAVPTFFFPVAVPSFIFLIFSFSRSSLPSCSFQLACFRFPSLFCFGPLYPGVSDYFADEGSIPGLWELTLTAVPDRVPPATWRQGENKANPGNPTTEATPARKPASQLATTSACVCCNPTQLPVALAP